MKLRIINAAQVRTLLRMSECIDVLERAMLAHSNGAVATPPRIIAPLIDNSGYFGLMPGSMADPAIYGAKVVSLHPGNPGQGRPAVQGFVTLFDHATGTPMAIIEGAGITAIRTAAASGLATRELARTDAATHGIFGAGVLAGTHLDAIAAVRPIERVVVWSRDAGKGAQFAAEQSRRTGIDVRATTNPAEAAACDVVSTVTGSPEPVLKGEWLRPGAHLNLVGAHSPKAREADSSAIAKAAIYVDSRASAGTEAGDLLIPISEGAITSEAIIGEIGEVLAGKIPGRVNGEQITLYKSLGIVAQDLFAAAHVLEAAVKRDIGQLVDFS